jgi:hypothetical protein
MGDDGTLMVSVLVPGRRQSSRERGAQMLVEQESLSGTEQMTRAAAALGPELWNDLAKIAPSLLMLASETLRQSQPALVQMIKRLNAKDEQILVAILKDMKQARLAVKRFGEILRTCEMQLIIAASELQTEAPKDLPVTTDVPIIRAEGQQKLGAPWWRVKRVDQAARLRGSARAPTGFVQAG